MPAAMEAHRPELQVSLRCRQPGIRCTAEMRHVVQVALPSLKAQEWGCNNLTVRRDGFGIRVQSIADLPT